MSNKQNQKKGRMWGIISVVIIIVLIGVIVFMVFDKNKTKDNTTKEAMEIKEKVEKLMYLPNETPTITTVENSDELKKQDFFKDVKNGDKVLIFIENTKVVIYRPSENRIVNVGPIVNDETTNASE